MAGMTLCGDSGVFFTLVLRRDMHKVILPWVWMVRFRCAQDSLLCPVFVGHSRACPLTVILPRCCFTGQHVGPDPLMQNFGQEGEWESPGVLTVMTARDWAGRSWQ